MIFYLLRLNVSIWYNYIEVIMEEIVETKEEKVEINDEANAKEIKKKKRKEKIKKKGSSFFADFKKFISKGNILDLAVAVVTLLMLLW